MTRKKGMPIPWDWDGESWECWAVEWPKSPLWQAILMGFVQTPSRGRFWDESTGDLLDVLITGREIDNRNNPLKEVLMACNEDTLAVLQAMADSLAALAAKDCCSSTVGGGSAGAGLEPAPANPFDLDPIEGDPPPGFADWPEYNTYACDMANYILTQMIADIATVFVVGAGAASAAALGTLLLTAIFTPIGWAALVGLAALFFTLLIAGINAATLTELLEDNRDDLVCSMLSGSDVVSKLADFGDAIEIAVAADPTISALGTIAEGLASDFLKSFASPDSFNRLIEKVPYEIPSAECDCGGEPLATIGEFGCIASITSGDFSSAVPTQVESCVSTVYGTSRANMLIGSTASPTNRLFEITGVTGNNGGMILEWSQGGTPQTSQNWPELDDLIGLTWEATTLHFIRNTGGDDTLAFELTFEVTEV